MTEPLLVLLLLVGNEASDPTTQGMIGTARTALGADAALVVDEERQAPSDEEALALSSRMHANVVAELRWSSSRERVTLHLHVDTTATWLDQEIAFEEIDAPTERGRTLGFALAAMISRWREEQIELRSQPPPAPARPEIVRAPPSETPKQPVDASRPFAFDLVGSGSAGLGGPGSGVGAALGARWLPTRVVGFGARGGARFGDVPAADASSRIVMVGAGVVFRPLGPAGPDAPELTLRTNIGAMHQSLARVTAGATVRRSRWITAADCAVEGAWYFGATFGVLATVGVEIAFGASDVQVGTDTVARLPLLRAAGELGARLRF